jgi:hypothetical protein
LEAFPQVHIGSILGGATASIDETDEAIIIRPPGADWSYAEMAYPGDFIPLHPTSAHCPGRTAWVFEPQFMERGVIRRLRLRGAFISRDGDVAAVRRLGASFAIEQPPLTA